MKKTIILTLSLLLTLTFNGYAQQTGDVNGDHEINIADINAVIDIILDGTDFITAADVNGDHEINIADINAIIDIILGGSEESDWVDLGLPSGTLWATRNIGASSPEDYGDYFAWGETEPKDFYDLYTYKWWESWDESGWTHWGYSKYCYSSQAYMGIPDDRTELDPEDDAATVNWGSGARTPSSEQIQELISSCTRQWTQRNDVNGMLVTGPNGNTIFLPATGIRYREMFLGVGASGRYWSRTVDGAISSDYLFVSSSSMYWNCDERWYGYPVRAVLVPQD